MTPIIEIKNLYFTYETETSENTIYVLNDVSLSMDAGKTYAFVGPTGGGKSTLSSLIAGLFSATKGSLEVFSKDINLYNDTEKSNNIGFILQEPITFTGTVLENIVYGNDNFLGLNNEEIKIKIGELGFKNFLELFNNLDQKIEVGKTGISLGQKQLIAFARAIIRKPKILILDEATANIDTVTEGKIDKLLNSLDKDTTKIIIAHRLNTIKQADKIFYVNEGKVKELENYQVAVELSGK